jgi:hypothetical protein
MNPDANPAPGGSLLSNRAVVFCAILVLLVVAGILINRQVAPESAAALAEEPSETTRRSSEVAPPHPGEVNSASTAALAPGAPVTAERAPSFAERLELARQLVAALVQIDLSRGTLTPEQIEQWKQNLEILVQQGSAAVPAIGEFLNQNMDVSFGTLRGGNLAGYSSLRIGLIEALNQIGGAEALALSLETLQLTADPLEIARLIRNLEQIAPGEYHQTAIRAAQEALALAMSGQIPDRDVGPLFKVLEQYGDPASIQKLMEAQRQWRYYGALALAGLPDGQGIPALIQMVANPNVSKSGRDSFGFQILAQAAPQYSQAQEALLAEARTDGIPNNAWPPIASALSGEHVQFANHAFDMNARWPNVAGTKIFHLEQNQNFASTPRNMPAEQVREHLRLVDQLLAVTTNPAGVAALTQARSNLAAKLQN